MNNINPQLLIKELELTYTTVVGIYLTCRNSPKPDDLHEFRREPRISFISSISSDRLITSAVKALEKKLDSMTQNLGKFNDLTQRSKSPGI